MNKWALEDYLIDNPEAGDLIRGGKSLRKLRWKLARTGKSGGIRVIYHYAKGEHIFFIVAYKKVRQENLTRAQLKMLTALLEE